MRSPGAGCVEKERSLFAERRREEKDGEKEVGQREEVGRR